MTTEEEKPLVSATLFFNTLLLPLLLDSCDRVSLVAIASFHQSLTYCFFSSYVSPWLFSLLNPPCAQEVLTLFHSFKPLKLDHVQLFQLQCLALHQLSKLSSFVSSFNEKKQCAECIKTYAQHASSSIRVHAVTVMLCCQGLDGSIIEQELFPIIQQLLQDPMYSVRRQLAETLPNLLQGLPWSLLQTYGIPWIQQLIVDTSKSVRDAMYTGLAHCLILFTNDPIWPPPFPALFPERLPDALFQEYCFIYSKWKDSDRLAKCAYTLPSMILSFPQFWTSHFRALYHMLALEPLTKIKKPLMYSFHCLASALTLEQYQHDVLPVLQLWLSHEPLEHQLILYARMPSLLSLFSSSSSTSTTSSSTSTSSPSSPTTNLNALWDFLYKIPEFLVQATSSWRLRYVLAEHLHEWFQFYLLPPPSLSLSLSSPRSSLCCPNGENAELNSCIPSTATTITTSTPPPPPSTPTTIIITTSASSISTPTPPTSPILTTNNNNSHPISFACPSLSPFLNLVEQLLQDPVSSIQYAVIPSFLQFFQLASYEHQTEFLELISKLSHSSFFKVRAISACLLRHLRWTCFENERSSSTLPPPSSSSSSSSSSSLSTSPFIVSIDTMLTKLAQDPVIDVRMQATSTSTPTPLTYPPFLSNDALLLPCTTHFLASSCSFTLSTPAHSSSPSSTTTPTRRSGLECHHIQTTTSTSSS